MLKKSGQGNFVAKELQKVLHFDQESWSFLRYFTSMPLFKHLVERIVLEKDDLDLKVFETRIIEN